jgi:hypothetical protein
MRRADTSGSKGRGALSAAVIALLADVALPLLPIYGGGHQLFWTGLSARVAAAFLIGQWASAVAVLIGIVVLGRQRSALAAGVFAATAIWAITPVVVELVQGPVSLDRYQTILGLALPTLEGAALAIAASIAVRRW